MNVFGTGDSSVTVDGAWFGSQAFAVFSVPFAVTFPALLIFGLWVKKTTPVF